MPGLLLCSRAGNAFPFFFPYKPSIHFSRVNSRIVFTFKLSILFHSTMSLVGSWISYTDFCHCTNYFICVFPHSSLRLRIGIILDSLYPSVSTGPGREYPNCICWVRLGLGVEVWWSCYRQTSAHPEGIQPGPENPPLVQKISRVGRHV